MIKQPEDEQTYVSMSSSSAATAKGSCGGRNSYSFTNLTDMPLIPFQPIGVGVGVDANGEDSINRKLRKFHDALNPPPPPPGEDDDLPPPPPEPGQLLDFSEPLPPPPPPQSLTEEEVAKSRSTENLADVCGSALVVLRPEEKRSTLPRLDSLWGC